LAVANRLGDCNVGEDDWVMGVTGEHEEYFI
jgi:hypothetical protein